MHPGLLLVAAIFIACPAFAAARDEWTDEDKDGRKETHFFYEGTTIVRAEADADGDGNIDRWVKYSAGKRYTAESDRNHDGRMDRWDFYTLTGAIGRTASDTNTDGKPDKFTTLLNGRQVVMKEDDRNGDGKVDRRRLCEWTLIKHVGAPSVPGHKPLWTEEDNDFNGTVDKYTDKKNRAAEKGKIGKPMDGRLTPFPGDPSAPIAPAVSEEALKLKRTSGKDRIDALNARHGFEPADRDQEEQK